MDSRLDPLNVAGSSRSAGAKLRLYRDPSGDSTSSIGNHDQCPPRLFDPVAGKNRAGVLLTCYMTGAASGKNLGVPGYSYDFVAQLYAPLLRAWGELREVRRPRDEFEASAREFLDQGRDAVHFCLLPFQDAYLSPSAANVVVPAWEFPDIPQDEFDGNLQNNWVATANRCALVIVGGPFTANALQDAGVTTPIRIVQVPTPEPYFGVAPWTRQRTSVLECRAESFPNPRRKADAAMAVATSHGPQSPAPAPGPHGLLRRTARKVYRRCIERVAPKRVNEAFTQGVQAAIRAWQGSTAPPPPPDYRASPLALSGVVYTSIFNPYDGRKNWGDLLSGFLSAVGDRDDATLVLKLISSEPKWIEAVASHIDQLDLEHRCKIAIVSDYLSESQMVALAQASTYYLSTTKAEGNCLPLMNYLAAGRPAISPCHTAVADYFNDDVGFVVESHPEPCAFPHDSRFRCRTSWHRLVWPSLVDQIRNSYSLVTHDLPAYEAMSARARRAMLDWCHPGSVGPRLWSALDLARDRATEQYCPAETPSARAA